MQGIYVLTDCGIQNFEILAKKKKKRYYTKDNTWPLVGTKFQSSSFEKYFTSERTKREISYLEAAM